MEDTANACSFQRAGEKRPELRDSIRSCVLGCWKRNCPGSEIHMVRQEREGRTRWRVPGGGSPSSTGVRNSTRIRQPFVGTIARGHKNQRSPGKTRVGCVEKRCPQP